MNRYALGAAMALLLLLALSGTGGINRLFRGNDQLRGGLRADDTNLGTLPIEQAGQAVQRQGSASGGVPMNPTNLPPSGDLTPTTNGGFTTPAGTPPAFSPTQPGTPQNVVPRQGITTLPAPLGDIAPVQPDLVRPDPAPPVTDDPELESIPALW
ncbi:hypothetical protein [Phormidium sp. FACHB-1136]|jgi:hypothetical protein|uniref:hypothetical protein n=1 Tax=Phormidium sp. FACHB-1136 TaxID=2692848 RepID=UPI0016887441|nr:hypothetical protein [Phormidium sp. FACHB-1136]MBD2426835.1 hypothetical protein [Phormidium sp. FACHB-1136]